LGMTPNKRFDTGSESAGTLAFGLIINAAASGPFGLRHPEQYPGYF